MMFLSLILTVTSALAAGPTLKVTDSCKKTSSTKMAYIVKQWHLGPNENTKLHPEIKPKPAQNQQEIYEALADWVRLKKIDTVLAEGCEGEINPSFKPIFNGWSYADLAAASALVGYSALPTHAVLKLEAKLTTQVRSICADDLAQVKNAQLALSDMRADLGFWSRLKQYEKEPAKAKTYLEGVVESFQLKKGTSVSKAIVVVRTDLKKSFDHFLEANSKRNAEVVRTLKSEKSDKPIAIVYGGLHASELKTLIEKEGFNCEVYEPLHYNNEEAKLIEEFKAALNPSK
jgi:hypothetical protein